MSSIVSTEKKQERAVSLCRGIVSHAYYYKKFNWVAEKTEKYLAHNLRLSRKEISINALEIRLRLIYWIDPGEYTVEMEIDLPRPGKDVETTKLVSEYPPDLDRMISELKEIHFAVTGFLPNED